MKIKILKDEYLFNENGHHVCNADGFAVKAEQDTECEVDEQHSDKVISLLSQDRVLRGLLPDGSLPVVEEPKVPQDLLDAEPGTDSSET